MGFLKQRSGFGECAWSSLGRLVGPTKSGVPVAILLRQDLQESEYASGKEASAREDDAPAAPTFFFGAGVSIFFSIIRR